MLEQVAWRWLSGGFALAGLATLPRHADLCWAFAPTGFEWTRQMSTTNNRNMNLRNLRARDPWRWSSGLLLVLLTSGSLAASVPAFVSAKPIWPKGRETEKNLFAGFRAAFKAPAQEKVVLRATGATLYRVFLNGHFLAQGPARGPHGYFRVDEWDLTAKLQPGVNVVAFEVAGYKVNSYYLLDQPSFLQAEVVAGGKVLASTRGSGAPFTATILKERVQKVQRYSFQRPFSEVYRLTPGCDRWRSEAGPGSAEAKVAVLPAKALLSR